MRRGSRDSPSDGESTHPLNTNSPVPTGRRKDLAGDQFWTQYRLRHSTPPRRIRRTSRYCQSDRALVGVDILYLTTGDYDPSYGSQRTLILTGLPRPTNRPRSTRDRQDLCALVRCVSPEMRLQTLWSVASAARGALSVSGDRQGFQRSSAANPIVGGPCPKNPSNIHHQM